MTFAKSGAVVVALGLLACGLSLASVRMDGLGWNLSDLIDDPVADMLTYPQLNVLSPGRLVGVEMNQLGYYHPYARATGRLSVAATLDAGLGGLTASCDPSLALATQVGPLSLGASARFAFIDEPVSPPKDISWRWITFNHDVGIAVVGVRWNRPAMALDVNVSGGEYDHYMWSTDGGSDTLFERYCVTSLTPLLRVTWLREHLSWRAIISYGCGGTDWPDHHFYIEERTLSLGGGPAFAAGNLLAVAGLRANASSYGGDWLWDLRLPAGVEWSPGPVVFRLGTYAQCSFRTSAAGATYQGFVGHVSIGLGLRPVEHLRLDFVPDMDNAANLRGWSLAAALDF